MGIEQRTTPVFGSVVTAMVTPFDDRGEIADAKVRQLASYLVDQLGNDTVLVNGTTGEAPTTTDAEKRHLIELVKAEVGGRAKVLAGVGTNDTRHTIQLAREASDAGADGLLVVTPYYNRPPQDALIAHFTAVADATELPNLLYDIPKRSGTPIAEETLIELAKHQRIVGVKDAKSDITSSARVMAATDLCYYSGDDAMTLPLLSVGAVGVVGTSTHFIAPEMKEIIRLFLSGDVNAALDLHQRYLPVMEGVFATQGCMLVKSGLKHLGLDVGGLRAPLLPASAEQAAAFDAILDSAGVAPVR